MIIIKKGFFIVWLALGMLLSGGCEILNDLLKTDSGETAGQNESREPGLGGQPNSAVVMESFDDQSSNWRPILPHELDAHFEESDALLKLMRYARRLNGLTAQEFEEEHQSFKSHPADENTKLNRLLQEALLLSAGASPFRNDQQAKKILVDFINSGEKRGLLIREFAYSLLLRIEQREKEEQQSLQLRKNLKKEIERRELLEQKLEALKSIEESITQRQNKTEDPAP